MMTRKLNWNSIKSYAFQIRIPKEFCRTYCLKLMLPSKWEKLQIIFFFGMTRNIREILKEFLTEKVDDCHAAYINRQIGKTENTISRSSTKNLSFPFTEDAETRCSTCCKRVHLQKTTIILYSQMRPKNEF